MSKPRVLVLLTGLALAATAAVAAPATAAPHGSHGKHGSAAPVSSYVALGDSYTAAPFVPHTDLALGCARSDHNYPHLVAQRLGLAAGTAAFTDVSCSGAQTKDMTTSQLPGVPPQFDALTGSTDLVTIGIGGNDSSVFGTLVGFCPQLRASDPTGAPCRDYMRSGGEDKLFAALAHTSDNVEQVVAQVHEDAPNARVLVVGYPYIVPRQGTCPSRLPLADGDYHYANQISKRLNQALRHAASATRSTYIDTYAATVGHDICSTDPWINGITLSAGPGERFHPIEAEQQAVADAILAALG